MAGEGIQLQMIAHQRVQTVEAPAPDVADRLEVIWAPEESSIGKARGAGLSS